MHSLQRDTTSVAFDFRCGSSNYDFIIVGVTWFKNTVRRLFFIHCNVNF